MANSKDAIELYLYLASFFGKAYLASTTPQKIEYRVVHKEQIHNIILTNTSDMSIIQSQVEAILQG